MVPAYPLMLTSQAHALIGELVEIMGQIDNTMIQTVARLLDLDKPAASKVMGSTRVADNAAIWSHAIRNHTDDKDVLALVGVAVGMLNSTAEIRNGFIHALFTPDYVEAGYMEPGIQTTSATRVKSGKTRPSSELEGARDEASMLSCLIAHIDHCMAEGEDPDTSPWREKLAPLLKIHQPTRPHAHQGKGRKAPPRPSQA